MTAVLACVDGSVYSRNVASLAGWAASRMGARVELLQAMDRRGPGRRLRRADPALETLEDERALLLRRQAELDLEEARVRVEAHGVFETVLTLEAGDLLEAIAARAPAVDLLVVGKRGLAADYARGHLGSNLERIARSATRPIMVASRTLGILRRIVIADDGGPSAAAALAAARDWPLFSGLRCDLVHVGVETPEARSRLEAVTADLRAAGVPAAPHLLHGQPDVAIADFVARNAVDMVLMGSYSHSRLRSFVIGSTTSELIRTCHAPIVLFP